MRDFGLDKNKNCLVAVSFGPDSMALLNLLMKENLKLIVCHVNYQTREASDFEEESLKKFCKKYNIICECLNAGEIKREGNFEAWARSVRYMFFKQMYVKYDAQCLFVGHQQDDLLETYLLQKDRNSIVARYGLDDDRIYEGMRVLRPLLMYTKQDLLEFCQEEEIPYSVDVTNFETKLKRNKIRHEIVSKMTESERDVMLSNISNENRELEKFERDLNGRFQIGEELEIREIISLPNREFNQVIRNFVNKNGDVFDLSQGKLDSIRKMCLSEQPNISMPLSNKVNLLKEYDVLVVVEDEEFSPYEYIMEKPSVLDEKEIYLDFSQGAEDRNIHDTSYPITIRNSNGKDQAIIGGNLCSVRRLYIDWKMPMRLRKMWPIFINKSGEVIYVPRYRKTFIGDNKKSIIVMKFADLNKD